MRFIIAPLIFVLGFLIIKYSYQIMNFFGRIDFAEKYFGGAGTNTLYKLAGVLFMAFAVLYLFGVVDFSSPKAEDFSP